MEPLSGVQNACLKTKTLRGSICACLSLASLNLKDAHEQFQDLSTKQKIFRADFWSIFLFLVLPSRNKRTLSKNQNSPTFPLLPIQQGIVLKGVYQPEGRNEPSESNKSIVHCLQMVKLYHFLGHHNDYNQNWILLLILLHLDVLSHTG